MESCTCTDVPITIFRGDDTDGLGYQSIKGKITTVLDLTGCKAVFRYLGFTQTIDPIPESGRFIITIPSDITAKFPPGMGFASLRVYDQQGKVRTFTNRIPVFVTMTAPAVVGGDFTVEFSGGALNLEPLKIWTVNGFVDYDGYVERIIDKATADRFGLAMLKDTFESGDDADSGIAATPKSVNAAYSAILGELTDNYYTAQETDEAINSLAAYYITSNAAGDAFPTKNALVTATTYYSGGVVRVPTRNDYAVVLADETHGGAEWRYIYATNGQGGQWEAQYPIETNDYEGLSNKPQINGVTLSGNKTSAELGLAQPSASAPIIAGTADAGSSSAYSRGDHVHPGETQVVAYRLPDDCFPVKYTGPFINPTQHTINSNDGLRFEINGSFIYVSDITEGAISDPICEFALSNLRYISEYSPNAVSITFRKDGEDVEPTPVSWPVLEKDTVFVRDIQVAKEADVAAGLAGKLGNSGDQTLNGDLTVGSLKVPNGNGGYVSIDTEAVDCSLHITLDGQTIYQIGIPFTSGTLALRSDIPYAINEVALTIVSGTASGTLSDHSVNIVRVEKGNNASLTLPAQVAGKSRDFFVRFVVTGFDLPSGNWTIPNASFIGTSLSNELPFGDYVFRFSEVLNSTSSPSANPIFLVTGQNDTYAIGLKAPLASPEFTGTPTAPTPTSGDNSTKVATTAFVQDALSGITPGPDNTKLDSEAAAPDYDATATYAEGEYVTYLGKLYYAKQAITTPEDWTAAHWQETDMTTPDATLDITSQGSLRVVSAGGQTLWQQGYKLYTIAREPPLDALPENESVEKYAFHANDTIEIVLVLPTPPTDKVGDFVLDVTNPALDTASFTQSAFSDSATYAVGAEVIYDSKIWRCVTAVSTAGAWTGTTNWEEAWPYFEIVGLGSTVEMVVPEGESLTDILSFAPGTKCELYFTLTSFAVDSHPTWKVVRQNVEVVA